MHMQNTKPKPNVNIRLQKSLIKVLDNVCQALGVTRSEFIRNAIIYYLSYLKSVSLLTEIKNAYNKPSKQATLSV